MELWAGFECTRNRVGDIFYDQLKQEDRKARQQCLEALSGLGVKAFRYRVAWDDPDLSFADVKRELAILSRQQIKPIIGLLHHGSGPPGTDLLAADFAEGLAAHARAVATQFPWVEYWTPINEPLTTARFSGLYGHWYPHATNEPAFWLALLNQVDATRLAMREIRAVNPRAKLVQTDDLGKTYATAALMDQAAFDNQRRWMAWDLLTGMVVKGHPFYERLCKGGFAERLAAIAADPCPPDIIGIDHYLTSDRFLDHRLARYPSHTHGGNKLQRFADVEAVRVLAVPPNGLETAICEAWERYRIPVAITECHNGCTREEQMRWLREGWEVASRTKKRGVDIVAVTSWAMIGARDWTSLATEERGDYESGAFDVRGGTARATGVANVMKAIAQDRPAPVAATGEGWWRRDTRLRYPPSTLAERLKHSPAIPPASPLLIAGATGTLGQALLRAARARGLFAMATTRETMALDCSKSVANAIERYRPWAVINATGWVRVDEAEHRVEECYRSNVTAALTLAHHCDRLGIANVHFSSDLVFGDDGAVPFRETDQPGPINVYGSSKAKADAALLELPSALIIRTAAFFSPFDQYNFAVAAIGNLRRGNRFAASDEQVVSPTYVPHLADFVLDLLIDGATGLWHASSGEEMNWHAFAMRLAEACNLNPEAINAASASDLGWVAKRPAYSGLASMHGQHMPPLGKAISEFAAMVQ